jgi:hypothetical protein
MSARIFSIGTALLIAATRLPAWEFTGTLDTNSTPGNFYGILLFSFSNTNPADWYSNPPGSPYGPGAWKSGMGINQTFTNPASPDQVTINLSAYSETPTELYVYGNIGITIAGHGSVSSSAIGGPGGLFPLGQSGGGSSAGDASGSMFDNSGQNIISYDVGFSMAMPWNGVSSDSAGSWWASYSVTPTPEPASATLIALALGSGLIWTVSLKHRRRTKMSRPIQIQID